VNRKNFTGTLGWDEGKRGDDGLKQNPDGTSHGQGSWFKIADSKNRGSGRKNPGFRFDGSGRSFQSESVERHIEAVKEPVGTRWFNDAPRTPESLASSGSKYPARKRASAQIAKIPLTLSEWIGRFYYPASHKTSN
jgi:hypothetical protein